MSGKKRKNRPKWGHVGKLGKRSLDEVASGFVTYMELTKAARKHLKATNRFRPKIDFRLYVEAEFCMSALLSLFRVSKAFIQNAQDTLLLDKERFKEEVKRFSESIIPEQPTLITKNLEGAMGEIMRRDKSLARGKRIIK